MDGRLRDSVHVHQLRTLVAMAFKPRFQPLQIERFAAKYDGSQCEPSIGTECFVRQDELIKRRRRLIEDRDLLVIQQPVKVLRRSANPKRYDNQATAIE